MVMEVVTAARKAVEMVVAMVGAMEVVMEVVMAQEREVAMAVGKEAAMAAREGSLAVVAALMVERMAEGTHTVARAPQNSRQTESCDRCRLHLAARGVHRTPRALRTSASAPGCAASPSVYSGLLGYPCQYQPCSSTCRVRRRPDPPPKDLD